MAEYLTQILDKISFFHLNILLLLGLALFGATVGGRIFQKLRIPQVVGYIIIGMIIGPMCLNWVDDSIIRALAPFNYFALGLIGFMVGGELKREVFSKYGKGLITILLCEGITPFILVSLAVGLVGMLLFKETALVWALAILLGSVASATDPATTTSVLREYKTRGPLTTNIIGIVALDDGLALFLFAIASSVADSLIGNGGGVLRAFIHPFYEIGVAVGVGLLSGLMLDRMLLHYAERERILGFSIGMVLLVTGICLAADISLILALMTLGVVVVNLRPHKSKDIFSAVEGFTPPIYVLFFVLVGAKLKFHNLTLPILILVACYLIYGMIGKVAGARIGAIISRAPESVRKYLPFALFSQAGIAIGLSILAAQHFPGYIGNTIVIIVTTSTFVTQLLGPPFTKYAVIKAEEAGLNVTEEDIIKTSTAEDFMDKNPPLVFTNMPLSDILRVFSENDSLYYPVVNKDRKLQGILTVEGIRQTVLVTDMGGLILAHDLMEPVHAKTSKQSSISEVREVMNKYDLGYIPVVNKDNILDGFLERKKLDRLIATKIIGLQGQTDNPA